jgi:hypothetical protein
MVLFLGPCFVFGFSGYILILTIVIPFFVLDSIVGLDRDNVILKVVFLGLTNICRLPLSIQSDCLHPMDVELVIKLIRFNIFIFKIFTL